MRELTGEDTQRASSWIDAFILGDVHILGFGYNTSEFDMWWLLDCKMREKANTGKVHYYYRVESEKKEDTRDTLNLLRCFGVTLHPIDEIDYIRFYDQALEAIRQQMQDDENR